MYQNKQEYIYSLQIQLIGVIYNRQIISKRMKVFHIDEFKCTLCSNWFCPPFNLPYRLRCTHSICTNCLQKSLQNGTSQIICPQDLERNSLSQININQQTKKALQRLLRQQKNFSQTNHLQCIKSLSLNFDSLLDSKQIQLKNLSTLIDQIFQNQIRRLKDIYQKIKLEINRPFRIVNDWKQVVRTYLKKVKQGNKPRPGDMNHYVDQGRKIKLDLADYLKYDFKQLLDYLLLQPQVCFTHNFTIYDDIQQKIKSRQQITISKLKSYKVNNQNTLGKQIQIQDISQNLDQSSIRIKKPNKYLNSGCHKMSLFDELISQTPKQNKNHFDDQQKQKKTPLRDLMFSSSQNRDHQNRDHQNRDHQKLQLKKPFLNNTKSKKQNFTQSDIKKQSPSFQFQQSSQKVREIKLKQNQVQMYYNSNLKQKIAQLKPSHEKVMLEYSPQNNNDKYSIIDSYQQEQLPLKSQITHYYQQSTTIAKHVSEQSDQQLLLDSDQKHKKRKEVNFLKQWKINTNSKQQQQIEVIRRFGQYDCEKQKNKYVRKIQEATVNQLLEQMVEGQNYIEIVGHSLADCNLTMLLNSIDWNYRNIEIVKFIKTSLSDQQLNQLLNFLVQSNVHTLMLSYNNLTELSLDGLLNFVGIYSKLKNIYLPKNNISLLKGHTRAKINLLKEKGINLYI